MSLRVISTVQLLLVGNLWLSSSITVRLLIYNNYRESVWGKDQGSNSIRQYNKHCIIIQYHALLSLINQQTFYYGMNNLPFLKIVVIGQGRVGKTSMSLKFVEDKFDEKQQSTINASYLDKTLTLSNNKDIKLAIWDTAGQEMYNAIVPVYYRDAYGAIVVFQIGSIQSFQKVKKWISELKEYAQKNIVIYVAGNKCDMQTLRKVSKKEAEEYAASQKIKYFEVSAKTGHNINKIFTSIAEEICEVRGLNNGITIGSKRKQVKIANKSAEKPDKEKKCC